MRGAMLVAKRRSGAIKSLRQAMLTRSPAPSSSFYRTIRACRGLVGRWGPGPNDQLQRIPRVFFFAECVIGERFYGFVLVVVDFSHGVSHAPANLTRERVRDVHLALGLVEPLRA